MKWKCNICTPPCNLEVACDSVPFACPFDEDAPLWKQVAKKKSAKKQPARKKKAPATGGVKDLLIKL